MYKCGPGLHRLRCARKASQQRLCHDCPVFINSFNLLFTYKSFFRRASRKKPLSTVWYDQNYRWNQPHKKAGTIFDMVFEKKGPQMNENSDGPLRGSVTWLEMEVCVNHMSHEENSLLSAFHSVISPSFSRQLLPIWRSQKYSICQGNNRICNWYAAHSLF